MMACAAMAPERLAFLSELYTRSAGDVRQGMPYEALIEALGFDERVTKRIQRELERERFVDLTTVPPMTHMGRPVMEQRASASPLADDRHAPPRAAAPGGPPRDACGHGTSHPLGASTRVRAGS